jgi:hypothetical protein
LQGALPDSSSHHDCIPNAPEQVARRHWHLVREGVDLKRVAVDLVNDPGQWNIITWLLEQGCYFGMDRFL